MDAGAGLTLLQRPQRRGGFDTDNGNNDHRSAWARSAHRNVMDSTLLTTASLCQARQIGLTS